MEGMKQQYSQVTFKISKRHLVKSFGQSLEFILQQPLIMTVLFGTGMMNLGYVCNVITLVVKEQTC